jgi:hypothetical protein
MPAVFIPYDPYFHLFLSHPLPALFPNAGSTNEISLKRYVLTTLEPVLPLSPFSLDSICRGLWCKQQVRAGLEIVEVCYDCALHGSNHEY